MHIPIVKNKSVTAARQIATLWQWLILGRIRHYWTNHRNNPSLECCWNMTHQFHSCKWCPKRSLWGCLDNRATSDQSEVGSVTKPKGCQVWHNLSNFWKPLFDNVRLLEETDWRWDRSPGMKLLVLQFWDWFLKIKVTNPEKLRFLNGTAAPQKNSRLTTFRV